MTCDGVLNAIELIAAGELKPDDRMAAHLATCASCASALEAARRLDALLRQRPVATPPAQFTSRTMARIRRARWRNEQMIDWGFNAALALVAVAVAAGIWNIVSRSGLTFAAGNDASAVAWRRNASILSACIAVSPPLRSRDSANRDGAWHLVVGRARRDNLKTYHVPYTVRSPRD